MGVCGFAETDENSAKSKQKDSLKIENGCET